MHSSFAAQALSHEPQCSGSVSVFTHAVAFPAEQSVKPPLQPWVVQAPCLHASPALHAVWQSPQWAGSDWRSTQLPPQRERPGRQTQLPLEHI